MIMSLQLNFESLKGKKIAYPESEDPRILDAAKIIKKKYGIIPILIPKHESEKRKEFTKKTIDSILLKKGKSANETTYDHIDDPYFFAGSLLQNKEVDCVISGCICPTSHVIRSALATNLLQSQTKIMTSCFYMEFEHLNKNFIFADCAVIPEPTPENLSEIAFLSQQAFLKWTKETPKIAFLSFSTNGSANHENSKKIRKAYEIFHKNYPNICSYGEIQFDAAFVPDVSNKKCPNSPLNGDANVFIFPDLNSGNICYKSSQYLGNGKAYGPILLGCENPFSDLSRGASVNDIVHCSLLTLLLSEN